MTLAKPLIATVGVVLCLSIVPASAQHRGGGGGARMSGGGNYRGAGRTASAPRASGSAGPRVYAPRAVGGGTRSVVYGNRGAVAAGPRGGVAVGPRGAVAAGPRGAVAVGPRGAVAVGPRGAVAVGRTGSYGGGRYYAPGRYYGSRYYGSGYYGSAHYYRPYYAFRPRFSVGVGLWVGYPVAYPYYGYGAYYGAGPYYPAPYGAAYPYPYPSSGYPYPYAASSYPGYSSSAYAAPAAPSTGSVELQQGEPNQTNLGGVSFEITPSTAQVFVDGSYTGTVADFVPTTEPLGLTPGRHRVEIRAAGYQTLALAVEVVAGQVIPYRGILQQQ